MEEEARVEISLENRFKEALRKAKEVMEYIKERNKERGYSSEPSIAECLAYDMQYVEKYVKQLEEENKGYKEYLKRLDELNAEDFILKSTVKEKIEEYKKNIDIAQGEELLVFDSKIDALEELLREE